MYLASGLALYSWGKIILPIMYQVYEQKKRLHGLNYETQ